MRLESSRRVKHRPQPGLGDVVAGALKAVGVKKHPGCGCDQKQAAMNAATPSWMRKLLGRLAQP